MEKIEYENKDKFDNINNDLKKSEIFELFKFKNKKTEKNRKTNKRRNELRKQNGKPLKRWSKWFKRDTKKEYLDETFDLKQNLSNKIDQLLINWNIIKLFESYGIELKESIGWYKWLCYSHTENTPSLSISKMKWVCKCYGCWKWWWPIINTIFELEFGEWTKKKSWRYKLLEEKINNFIKLKSISNFTNE